MAEKLAVTSYGLLGLLSFGDRSGYDLVKLIAASIGHFWTPAKSQIYQELKRLAARGFVSERRVRQEARPDKRIYALTEEGRAALEEWLADPDFEEDQVRSVTMLKVFFGAQVPRAILVARIKEVAARNEMKLAALRAIEADIKDQDEWFFPYLTLRSGLLHGEANIRWAEDALRLLDEKEGGP